MLFSAQSFHGTSIAEGYLVLVQAGAQNVPREGLFPHMECVSVNESIESFVGGLSGKKPAHRVRDSK
jgi:hypothetical protein